MTGSVRIALDAMGGDNAPDIIVEGAALAIARSSDLRFDVFGDEQKLASLLAAKPDVAKVSALHHTPEAIHNEAKPSAALRRGRRSSMRLAIDAVRAGKADAAVSAGNTGALMAMSKVVLGTLPGIDRPAIASVFPAVARNVVILDLGANADCTSENLVQFALMGAVYAHAVNGIERPTVALLNIGTEDLKGDDVVRDAAQFLRENDLPMKFEGFVEGTGLMAGTVDVVVTDGFTGNVALKVAEGTAFWMLDKVKTAVRDSWTAKLGMLLARNSLRRLRSELDPRHYNGAMFVGLGGVVVKSHGGADALGFANAIQVAESLVRTQTNERIGENLTRLHPDDQREAS